MTLSSISSDAKKRRRRKKKIEELLLIYLSLWKAKWERFASFRLKHSISDSPGVAKRSVSLLHADGGYSKIPSINSHSENEILAVDEMKTQLLRSFSTFPNVSMCSSEIDSHRTG